MLEQTTRLVILSMKQIVHILPTKVIILMYIYYY